MPLEPVAEKPGLWRDPQWVRGMPGLYAVVIGVSAYPHLAGGDDPAEDTLGLGQLLSSASTAAAVFEWLRRDFLKRELPVVWCQLLLSPTQDELAALQASGLTHYGVPDYLGMHQALQTWAGQVPHKAPAHEQSRTLFFFSGHGVQSNRNGILLPSDYLNSEAGEPRLQNCFGTRDLREWMESHPVAEHLALLDACQNELPELGSKGARAHPPFEVVPTDWPVPRTAATLAATSPNSVAYQGAERTFFGQALLEALAGRAGNADDQVTFLELVDYVQPRVNALLHQQDPDNPLLQPLRPNVWGQHGLVVTEFAAPEPPPAASPPPRRTRGARPTLAAPATPPAPAAPHPGMRRATRGAPPGPVVPAVLQADARFDPTLTVEKPVALSVLRGDFNAAHDLMGHEHATHPWVYGASLLSLADGSPLDLELREVQRNADSTLVQVDLLLGAMAHGVLLVFEGAAYVQRERLAVALPTDAHGQVPIRLTLAFGAADAQSPMLLQKLDARLGPSAQNPHYAYLWELTRHAELDSLRQAAALADPARLQRAARDKINGQTAATAGMLLLAQGAALARVQDWPRNLMDWFPWLPDGAVLWAEALRQAVARGEPQPFGVDDPAGAIAQALLTLRERGLPFFAECIELADSLLRHSLRLSPDGPHAADLQVLAQWLRQVFEVAMPGGHFTVLAASPRPHGMGEGSDALSVEELLGLCRPVLVTALEPAAAA
jgi:hypothetical protein